MAALVARHMPLLPFGSDDLRSLPRDVVADAASLFAVERSPETRFDG